MRHLKPSQMIPPKIKANQSRVGKEDSGYIQEDFSLCVSDSEDNEDVTVAGLVQLLSEAKSVSSMSPHSASCAYPNMSMVKEPPPSPRKSNTYEKNVKPKRVVTKQYKSQLVTKKQVATFNKSFGVVRMLTGVLEEAEQHIFHLLRSLIGTIAENKSHDHKLVNVQDVEDACAVNNICFELRQ